jgi:hypothetical protein
MQTVSEGSCNARLIMARARARWASPLHFASATNACVRTTGLECEASWTASSNSFGESGLSFSDSWTDRWKEPFAGGGSASLSLNHPHTPIPATTQRMPITPHIRRLSMASHLPVVFRTLSSSASAGHTPCRHTHCNSAAGSLRSLCALSECIPTSAWMASLEYILCTPIPAFLS